ncbi:putative Sulfatase [Legionella beliardensis]|uniref:Putative Sulfatase n=1 Tax=Legionella beliardensis TaxID=91822 RepID=A0A378HY61_9GAMM|nr:sulfatase-like hydrolase/transferase [Legionella beliardensis]STX27837.1 putative Sulfatase [Legionella beliardensis]
MKKAFQFKQHLGEFFIYNLVFVFLQFLFIFGQGHSFIQAMAYPIRVYLELLAALFIQLILYGILSWLQTGLLWGVARFATNKTVIERWQVIIYSLSLTALVTLNCYFFPLSKFSGIFLPEAPSIFINGLMIISLAILLLLTLITLSQFLYKKPWWTIPLALAISLVLFLQLKPTATNLTNNQPNLIIIGVDSFSPDQVNSAFTPNLYKYLQESVHFTEVISPLARTYPAWITILTGLYPLHHQARENLYPLASVNYMDSLAWMLRQKGYYTVFASDDRRFNNLGQEFGFNEIIGPRIGVNEILMGSLYDTPLSNLLINLRLTKWLFPYNYANRAGHFSYYTSTFDLELQNALAKADNKRPLFFAVHFTLPHWPYAWATSSPVQVDDVFELNNREILYNQAIQQVDQQVGTILKFLTQHGALTNSFVIVLSDHGEVLYKKGSRHTDPRLYQSQGYNQFINYLKKKTDTKLQRSAGHGSDLLSPAQNQCVLGFKIFEHGKLITQPKTITTRIALIDIAPTIAAFFNFNLRLKPDGISLLNSILGNQLPPPNRGIMLESGMLPNLAPTPAKVIQYAKELFQINPSNTHLEIRQDKFATINSMKLYGLIKDNWLLALYPDDGRYITVILQLDNGYWTDNLNSPFAKSTPVLPMLKELQQFYTEDLSHYPYVLKASPGKP